jgi:preprotein translocase subunit SecA
MRIAQEAAHIEDDAAREKKTAEIEAEIAAARQQALAAGGLYIVGSERHESRRIDNQLRGRAGRQGDPGASKFFLSLEDDLMRIFGSERMDSMLQKLGLQEGEAIVHPWVNKALEKAQQKVEARHFEGRKYLLKYDDVMNDQRKVVFEQRKDLMRADDVQDTIEEMRADVIETLVARFIPAQAYSEQWQTDSLHEEVLRLFGLDLPIQDWAKEEGIADQEIRERIAGTVKQRMAAKTANFGPEVMRGLEKQILLLVLDRQWKDHLLSLDHLRQGVQLRAYGQRDPLIEYKREAFDLFENMLAEVREETVSLLSRVELRPQEDVNIPRPQQEMHEGRQDVAMADAGAAAGPAPGSNGQAAPQGAQQPRAVAQPTTSRAAAAEIDPRDPSTWGKVSRNAACPCGSGKKYKHCHGKL